MANTAIPYNAVQDSNTSTTLIAVSGTVGTSDTTGTAEVIRVGANPATGALYVQDLSGASGTTNVNITSGTLPELTNIVGGTLKTLGTVGVVNGGSIVVTVGTINNGTINNIVGGTIGSILGVGGTVTVTSTDAGTNVNIVTGTQQTLGTVGVLNAGSIVVTAGTAIVTIGTVVGPTAHAGSVTTNPVMVGGTNSGGSAYAILVDTAGNPQVDVVTIPQVSVGTIPNVTITSIIAGTQNTLGTVGVVNSIVAGTQNTLGTLGVLNAGSVVVTAGTISDLDTVGTVGVVNGGSIVVTVGTVGGKVASGGSAVNNPVLIAGTDAGGTVYAPLVTTGGALSIVEVPKGTITNLATGTINAVTSVTNLVAGTVSAVNTIVAGTQNTLGTVGVLNAGTLGAVTSVTNLVGGTVSAVNTIVAGTQNTLGTVGVLNAGSVVVTIGTILKQTAALGTLAGTTVTNANTLIIGSNSSRKSFTVVPEGTTDLYLGFGTGVTAGSTGNGFPILSNQIFGMDDYHGAVYGIVAAGSIFVKYIQV